MPPDVAEQSSWPPAGATVAPDERHRNHGTVPEARRPASFQSTPIAEGVYAALGFADLGRYLEYVPPIG